MSFDGRTPFPQDREIEAAINAAFHPGGPTPAEILQAFPIYARRVHLKRFLAHYTLFQKVIDLPGDIVELGVYRGVSLMSWANFLEIHCMGDRQRKVWGFDSFEGLSPLEPEDGAAAPEVGKTQGGYQGDVHSEAMLRDAIHIFDADRFIPYKPRVQLVKGDICETVPQWVKDNPGVRISLLHFDCDLYRPTKVALEALWPLVVPGGVVAFDEYGIAPWEGETRAVEEFFEQRAILAGAPFPNLHRFPWSSNPGAWLIK